MTDKERKAMQMALEALENHSGNYKLSKTECVHHNAAVEALRQALADQKLADAFAEDFPNTWGKKKHTAPPSKPWVSLTDEERSDVIGDIFGNILAAPQKSLSLARAIEVKLREKNT